MQHTDPHAQDDIRIIGRYLEEHTPQLRDPAMRSALATRPSTLLSMGFLFGLQFQAQAPMTAEGILAATPRSLQEQDDAINGLINALTAARVARRRAEA